MARKSMFRRDWRGNQRGYRSSNPAGYSLSPQRVVQIAGLAGLVPYVRVYARARTGTGAQGDQTGDYPAYPANPAFAIWRKSLGGGAFVPVFGACGRLVGARAC